MHRRWLRAAGLAFGALTILAIAAYTFEIGIFQRAPGTLRLDLSRSPPRDVLLEGFGEREAWGRWTTGDIASIVMADALPDRVRLSISGYGFASNADAPIRVRAGNREAQIVLGATSTTVILDLAGIGPAAYSIDFIPVKPVSPAELGLSSDTRRLGIAISAIDISPLQGTSVLGIPLSDLGGTLEGFSDAESWGRWTDGEVARVHFPDPLQRRVSVLLWAMAFGPNVGQPVRFSISGSERTAELAAHMAPVRLDFVDVPPGSSSLEILIPAPTSPQQLGLSADRRRLGVGLAALAVLPLRDEMLVEVLSPSAPASGRLTLTGLNGPRVDTIATIYSTSPLPPAIAVEIQGHRVNGPTAGLLDVVVDGRIKSVPIGSELQVSRVTFEGIRAGTAHIYLRKRPGDRDIRAITALRVRSTGE